MTDACSIDKEASKIAQELLWGTAGKDVTVNGCAAALMRISFGETIMGYIKVSSTLYAEEETRRARFGIEEPGEKKNKERNRTRTSRKKRKKRSSQLKKTSSYEAMQASH